MNDASKKDGKKEGFLGAIWESMTKTSEGCGPGCGCHAKDEKKKATGSESAKDGRK